MEKAEFTLRYFYCAAAGGLFLQIDGVALCAPYPKSGIRGTRHQAATRAEKVH
jgi:hypothetical protein